MRRALWGLATMAGAAALFLGLMVGMFWILDVLPLLGLLVAVGVYAAGSASRPAGGYEDGPRAGSRRFLDAGATTKGAHRA